MSGGVKKGVTLADQVVIDFSELSYAEVMAMSRLEASLGRASLLGERLGMAGADRGAIYDELLALSHPDNVQAVYDAVAQNMAKVVRSVPRAWFVKSAPETLDFSDPAVYGYLRGDKAKELRQMIQQAQQPEDMSKNSEGSS